MEHLIKFITLLLEHMPVNIRQSIEQLYFSLQSSVGDPYADYLLIGVPSLFIIYGVIGHANKKMDFFYSYSDAFFTLVPFFSCAVALAFKPEYFNYTLYFLAFCQLVVLFFSMRVNGFLNGIMSFFAKLCFALIWSIVSILLILMLIVLGILYGMIDSRKKYERKAKYRERNAEKTVGIMGFGFAIFSFGVTLLCRNNDFSFPEKRVANLQSKNEIIDSNDE